jgi:ABC-type dipeptide/oligopeptide/nickel transport system permease component
MKAVLLSPFMMFGQSIPYFWTVIIVFLLIVGQLDSSRR